jgi:hypothetical protein
LICAVKISEDRHHSPPFAGEGDGGGFVGGGGEWGHAVTPRDLSHSARASTTAAESVGS